MKDNQFALITASIEGNELLREPQKAGYKSVFDHFITNDTQIREVGIVLPVGCGKSGLITILPFALKSKRALVLAPGLNIKNQLFDDFNPSNPDMFYLKCKIIAENDDFPEPVFIEGNKTNASDMDQADVVITNIHQMQGSSNKWISSLPEDFFDLIIVDEAHHNVADSWDTIRQKFHKAKIINLSATPARADGQVMAGDIIYSYPIFKAIENGYIKKLKAKVLNPSSLKFIRSEDGVEQEVSIEEIRSLGETDSKFRRGILSEDESLKTIIDCSIRELQEIRKNTGNNKHKIIASAINYDHCIQITEAYRARDMRAEYVHSNELSPTNDKILKKLENHEIDVIVQVKKLGEGFDHPYLSVAAVCSVFSNLSPFAQFIGRIMRVVEPNAPDDPNNHGVVVFHAGANIANRWSDFQEFSGADQDYFSQLTTEEVNFSNSSELEVIPRGANDPERVFVSKQENVTIQEIPLIEENTDDDVVNAIKILQDKGYGGQHIPVPVTKQNRRNAAQKSLDERIGNITNTILVNNATSGSGTDLDKQYLGKNNYVVIKSEIDKRCNELVGKEAGERNELSQSEIDSINDSLSEISLEVERYFFDA